MSGGRTLNQSTDPIKKAWLNLYVCITTEDINAFYMALSGHTPRECDNHYTWNEVHKTAEPRTREATK